MYKPSISIIVPVHNETKEELIKTFSCLENQTNNDFELIVVDDGSDEDIAQFCDFYFKNKTGRVIVLHQQGNGVSSARNHGLEQSAGKFIMFLDAGDWIEKNCVEIVLKKEYEFNCDFIAWNFYYNYFGGKIYQENAIRPNPVIFEGEKVLKDLSLDMVSPYYDERYHGISLGPVRDVWGKLYKSEIIKQNKIRFDSSLQIGEDAVFNLHYLKFARKAMFFNLYLNHYFIKPNSAIRGYRTDIVNVRCNLIEAYRNHFSHNFSAEFETVIAREILSAVVSSLRRYICNRSAKLSDSDKRKEVRSLLNRAQISIIDTLKYDINFFSLKEKILLYLIKNKRITSLVLLGKLISL